MSQYESNPFADPDANPFADPAVTQVTNQSAFTHSGLDDYNPFADQPTQPTSQVRGAANPPFSQPVAQTTQPAVMQPVAEPPPPYTKSSAQSITTAELQRRQEELDRKAAELQAREDALKSTGVAARENNWPPLPKKFCVGPCFYQDINVDIPVEFQKLVRGIYYLWIFYVGLLFFNMIGALALMLTGGGGETFGFSLLALVVFTPLSYVCWFRPLYKAFRSDSSFNFMVFFCIFFCQIILAVIYAIGIPNAGSCGFINGIGEISSTGAASIGVGGLMLVIALLWALGAFMAAVLLIKVHRIYRYTGASFAKAQQEFASEILHNEHVQQATTQAMAGAARQAVNQTLSGGNRY